MRSDSEDSAGQSWSLFFDEIRSRDLKIGVYFQSHMAVHFAAPMVRQLYETLAGAL